MGTERLNPAEAGRVVGLEVATGYVVTPAAAAIAFRAQDEPKIHRDDQYRARVTPRSRAVRSASAIASSGV